MGCRSWRPIWLQTNRKGFDSSTTRQMKGNKMSEIVRVNKDSKEAKKIINRMKENLKKKKHCDDYINDHNYPICLRYYLLVNRLPATDKYVIVEAGHDPNLFADYEGKRVRVVMASRFGDVGITYKLDNETGYSERVHVSDLSNFSAE